MENTSENLVREEWKNPTTEFLTEIENSTDVNFKIESIRGILDSNEELSDETTKFFSTNLKDFLTEHENAISETEPESETTTEE